MYYFVVHFLKPRETSVLPWLCVRTKCSFLKKDSWDSDPSHQPKVFGDLRKWHVVALKDVRLRPMCWSLLIGWGKIQIIHSQRPVSKKKISIKTMLQLCSAVWHVTSSCPQGFGSWKTPSEIARVNNDVNSCVQGETLWDGCGRKQIRLSSNFYKI